jgi:cobalt-zinc-cadmium efflux system protein
MSDAHHKHDHRHHGLVDRGAEGGRLKWVLIITALFMIAEVVGGLISGSLALLADSGHMFTDVGALALSLFAMRIAQRPPNAKRTFGYVRLEILAALVNGATLLLIAGVIMIEAWQRLRDPVAIDGTIMLGIATLGLGVNIIGASLLHSHAHDNLNVRGAYLHVLGDLLGSVGAIAAGIIVLTTGWTPADAIISVVIALLILFSAWKLVREGTDVLMESVPPHIDMDEVLESLAGIDGLDEIHDVHVWTLTSGFVAISAHGVIDDPTDHSRVLNEVRDLVASHGIDHVTFQIEMRRLYQIPTVESAS